jgi:hypothetical protein
LECLSRLLGLILTRRGRCDPVKSGFERAAGAQFPGHEVSQDEMEKSMADLFVGL